MWRQVLLHSCYCDTMGEKNALAIGLHHKRRPILMYDDISTHIPEKDRLTFVSENLAPKKIKQEWWIPGMIPKGKLVLLSAMGGTGKTSLALHLATRLCLTKQARVVFWSFEDTNQDLRNKMSDKDWESSLGLVTYWREGKGKKVDLTKENHAIQLHNALCDIGADILVIDPISQLLKGDTNDNQKVRAALAPLLQMTADLQLTVLGIHHFRKPSGHGTSSARGNIMGASAWVDSSRHVLSLVSNEQGQLFLEVVKSNIARTGRSWEVFTEVDDDEHFYVSGMADADDMAAQKALDEPEEERVTPVIKNLKAEFDLGQPFNLDDVRRCGNFKSFYNWKNAHPGKIQKCATKKNNKVTYIFI